MSFYGLNFKSKHSLTDYSSYIRSKNRMAMPPLIKREMTLPGKHGAYDFGNNVYDKKVIEVELIVIASTLLELRQKARLIAAWLSGSGVLYFDDEPDKYYQAKVYDSVSLNEIATSGAFTVSFECQPMALYTVTSTEDIILDSNVLLDSDILLNAGDNYKFDITGNTTVQVDNTGLYEINAKSQTGSLFNIVITGAFTTLSIAMNGKTINYTEASASGTITIDSVACTVKKGTTNKLQVCTGDINTFFTLLPGVNDITISGTGLNCSVSFDFRPLYL